MRIEVFANFAKDPNLGDDPRRRSGDEAGDLIIESGNLQLDPAEVTARDNTDHLLAVDNRQMAIMRILQLLAMTSSLSLLTRPSSPAGHDLKGSLPPRMMHRASGAAAENNEKINLM